MNSPRSLGRPATSGQMGVFQRASESLPYLKTKPATNSLIWDLSCPSRCASTVTLSIPCLESLEEPRVAGSCAGGSAERAPSGGNGRAMAAAAAISTRSRLAWNVPIIIMISLGSPDIAQLAPAPLSRQPGCASITDVTYHCSSVASGFDDFLIRLSVQVATLRLWAEQS